MSVRTEVSRKEKEMTAEKILTKHPLGKSGKNIDRKKYDTLKKAILSALRKNDLTHTELFSRLNKSLKKASSQEISVGMAKPLNSIWKLEK
jgi:hypothetical protein